MRRAALIASIALLSAPAARAEGPGIRVGETLVLHLGLLAGVGYDSNPSFSSGTSGIPVFSAAHVSIIPSLDLATRPAQRGGDTPHTLNFRLHLGSSMRFLLPVTEGSKNALSGRNSYDVDAGLGLQLYPFGNYAFDFGLNFARLMFVPYGYQLNANINTINADQGQGLLKLRLRPGGQRLEISLQYLLGFYILETEPYTGRSNVSNDFQLRISWKFFPKTALYINVGDTIYTYVNRDSSTPGSAYPLRAVLGVIGLITPTLSVNVNIGYGNSFQQANTAVPAYSNPKSYNMVIAQVEGTWKPLLTTALTIGYRHDFQQALVGTYYSVDSPYLLFQQQIWRIAALLRFAYEYRAYAGDLTPSGFRNGSAGVAERRDHLIAGTLQLDLPVKDWFIISIADTLMLDRSNCVVTVGSLLEPCNYTRNDVWLRLGVAY